METKKKSKGLIILVVVLSTVALGALAHIGYNKLYTEKNLKKEIVNLEAKYKKSNEELKKEKENNAANDSKIKDMENSFKESSTNYIQGDNRGEHRFYAFGGCEGVYSYKGEMYSVHNLGICGSLYHHDEEKFKNGSVSRELGDCKSVWFHKYNIKEKDVYKVVINHAVGNGDPKVDKFFIMKDGTVKMFGFEEIYNKEKSKAFSKYKVKDINEECNNWVENGNICEKINYNLTLWDGSKKIVSYSYGKLVTE